MSITDELREWASSELSYKTRFDELIAIADRIDAEHEAALLNVHTDLMDASGWIRLPKDADGEYIHVGDEMEFSAFEVEKPVTRTVDGIGQGVFFAWCGERGYQQHEAKRYCHHHAPTVEDVLREFANEVYADADNEIRDRDFLCAKYAKRLTLAEGEDA